MRFERLQFSAHKISRDSAAAQIREVLRRAVVVHICPDIPIDQPLGYWEDVIGRLGSFKAVGEDPSGMQTEKKSVWMDVRFDPRYGQSFRHFNSAQPLHTDGAYEDTYVDSALFYCERQASSGGATLFVDVEDLARILKQEDPSLYRDITTTPVHFSKLGRPGKTCPIVDADRAGVRVNWNYYRVTPDQGEKIEALRETFHQFLNSRFVEGGEALALRLEPHECVFFQDSRVLHGRNAYEAEASGDRLIWKCYFTRENGAPQPQRLVS